jgi:hypothetical protein
MIIRAKSVSRVVFRGWNARSHASLLQKMKLANAHVVPKDKSNQAFQNALWGAQSPSRKLLGHTNPRL